MVTVTYKIDLTYMKCILAVRHNMDLPGVKYIWVHLVQLIEACKNKFVLWKAIVGSFVWANWIKSFLIFLYQSNRHYEYKAELRQILFNLVVPYAA
jgi:hypothetical protein